MNYQSKISDNAKIVLKTRYLAKDENGDVIEDIPGMFHRIAAAIAAADTQYEGPEAVAKTEEEFYEMMTNLDFLPNSPTLMNAGRPLGQLSACFVLPIGDSMEEIFDTVKNAALIHKSGGGTGFSFSRLRPTGSAVKSTGGIASGPVSFMKVFNAATEAVKQGGTRRGANMGILRVDHPDVLEFINCKNDTHQINNFNISVALTDVFMKAVEEGTTYDLIDPRTNLPVKSMDAREVYNMIVTSAWRTGEPGVVFIDRINQYNPLKSIGMIESTNPCGEQPLLPYEACNLGSINLANHVTLGEDGGRNYIDFDKLGETVRKAVHFLDNVIDVNKYPLPEIDEMTRSTRKIGLGVMGFADMLLLLNVPYNSDEGLEVANEVMSFIEEAGWAESTKLAAQRGSFPAYDKSDYAGKLPVRNATVTTIAPTGTISMIAGVSSGIEPIFAYAYIRNIMDGTHLIESNPILNERLEYLRASVDVPSVKERIVEEGTLAHITILPQSLRDVFVCAHDITPEWHVRMQNAFQRYTDNAVSKTINFPNSATIEDVMTAYNMAYFNSCCKGITVYRDGSRESQVLNIKKVNDEESPKEENTTAAESSTASVKLPPEATESTNAPVKDECTKCGDDMPCYLPRDRADELEGFTRKIPIGCGKLYVTVNHDPYGICEVFTNNGKGGGCPSQSEATARLVSIALRAGVDIDTVIEQLRGIRCPSCQRNGNVSVLSCPDAIGRMLQEAKDRIATVSEVTTTNQGIAEMVSSMIEATTIHQDAENSVDADSSDIKFARNCPECGSTLEHEGGCVICRNCGFSKCG